MTTFIRTLLLNIIWFLEIAILGRILISWVQNNPNNRFHQFFIQITEPLLGPIRRILPRTGMFDLSPIVLILLLSALEQVIRQGVLF